MEGKKGGIKNSVKWQGGHQEGRKVGYKYSRGKDKEAKGWLREASKGKVAGGVQGKQGS